MFSAHFYRTKLSRIFFMIFRYIAKKRPFCEVRMCILQIIFPHPCIPPTPLRRPLLNTLFLPPPSAYPFKLTPPQSLYLYTHTLQNCFASYYLIITLLSPDYHLYHLFITLITFLPPSSYHLYHLFITLITFLPPSYHLLIIFLSPLSPLSPSYHLFITFITFLSPFYHLYHLLITFSSPLSPFYHLCQRFYHLFITFLSPFYHLYHLLIIWLSPSYHLFITFITFYHPYRTIVIFNIFLSPYSC